MRRTVNKAVTLRGVGLHGGQPATVTVAPAAAGAGLLFQRRDLAPLQPFRARHDLVSETRRCSCLTGPDGTMVCTVEHLLAALAACGISDAMIAVDGPELPIMDGSALAFAEGLLDAGIRNLDAPLDAIRILAPVSVERDGKSAALAPAERFEMAFTIDFPDPAIGTQSLELSLGGDAILRELADSRTFGCLAEVEVLRRLGLARGGSLDNAVVVDRGRVLNPEGLRHADEFVRHKMLDAVGDLSLAGAPIIGRFTCNRGGHEITNALLHALFARPEAWEWCQPGPDQVPGPAEVPAPLAKTARRLAV